MAKQKRMRINISIAPDTAERLKQYAYENHTNVSQAITDWIWSVNVKSAHYDVQELQPDEQRPSDPQPPEPEIRPNQVKVTLRPKKENDPGSSTLGYATITIEDRIRINPCRIVDGMDGPYMQMPPYKGGNENRLPCFQPELEFRMQLNEKVAAAVSAENWNQPIWIQLAQDPFGQDFKIQFFMICERIAAVLIEIPGVGTIQGITLEEDRDGSRHITWPSAKGKNQMVQIVQPMAADIETRILEKSNTFNFSDLF